MNGFWEYFIPALMLVFSAFFSGTEIAFVTANKLKIELKNIQGEPSGRILSKFIKNTHRVITTLLIGNSLALVIWGIYFGNLIRPHVDYFFEGITNNHVYLLTVEAVISTLIILYIGEYMPKAAFRLNPDRMITFFGPILNVFYVVFGPFVVLINGLTHFILKYIFKSPLENEALVFSKTDLDYFIKENLSEGEGAPLHEIDQEMFSNALEFNKIRARDCMVPRTEIVSVPLDTPIEELKKLFIETELSKIMIFGENLDDVKGYVHSSSLFKKPGKIHEVLQTVLVVPESMPAHMLLQEFTRNRKSVALVIDEFGGTEGLVTGEDLIEQVFGEIEDEHDLPGEEDLMKKQLGPDSWLFSARLEVYEINKEFGMDLPEGDYSTLAGLVIHLAENIPSVNESVMCGFFKITVTDASENRINLVKIENLGAAGPLS